MARNKFTVNPSTDIHLVDAVLTRYNDSELEIDVNAVNTDAELQRGDADKKEEVSYQTVPVNFVVFYKI